MKAREKNVASLLGTFSLLLIAGLVHAHVTISPKESTAGVIETYSLRVPTERTSPTVQIEVDVPAEVAVETVDTATDWEIEYIRDAEGRINRVIWSGGSILPGTSEVFTFKAQNPEHGVTLIWKAVQIHADGSKAEWIAGPGTSNPAPQVEIKNK